MGYEVITVDVGRQPIISIRARRRQGELPDFIGSTFEELFHWLAERGIDPAGPPFVIYHEFGPHEIDAEVCVAVAAPIEGTDRIRVAVVPPMTVARTLHVGPYEQLGEAYRAISTWTDERRIAVAGPVRERYLNGPGDEGVTPVDYRTEIEVPVVLDPVAAPA